MSNIHLHIALCFATLFRFVSTGSVFTGTANAIWMYKKTEFQKWKEETTNQLIDSD